MGISAFDSASISSTDRPDFVAAAPSIEAVRSVRRWEVGDEPAGACVDGVRVDDSSTTPEAGDHGTAPHHGRTSSGEGP